MKPQSRYVAAAVNGSIRAATFMGREHLVIPVVALVETVVHASNSDAAEMVPNDVLSKVPAGWNGRPVMMNHPALTSSNISANKPKVLEESMLGHVFNAEARDGKLLMEAWIDLDRSNGVPGGADLVKKIRDGEMLEVSIGAFVHTQDANGEFNGKQYQRIWDDLVPDHLALLPPGVEGACNRETGCGAPRAASAKETKMKLPFAERMKALMDKINAARTLDESVPDGQSDSELRNKLSEALFGTEPAFMYLDSVFPEDKKCVYAVAPDGALQMFSRDYSVAEDGAVSLGDKVEVKAETKFVPVMAQAAAGCGCNKKAELTAEGGDVLKKDRILAALARLEKHKPVLYSVKNAAAFEILSDEGVKALEAEADDLDEKEGKKQPVGNPPAPGEVKPGDGKPTMDQPNMPPARPGDATPREDLSSLTDEQKEERFLATAPEGIRRRYLADKQREKAQHAELVTQLKGVQAVYSEARLQAMSVDQLIELSALVTAGRPKTSFEGAAPRAGAVDVGIPAAPSLDEKVKQLRARN